MSAQSLKSFHQCPEPLGSSSYRWVVLYHVIHMTLVQPALSKELTKPAEVFFRSVLWVDKSSFGCWFCVSSSSD